MIRRAALSSLLLFGGSSAFSEETDWLVSRDELAAAKHESTRRMNLVFAHYLAILSKEERRTLQDEQGIWKNDRISPCLHNKSIEGRDDCLGIEYAQRAKSLDSTFAASLKRLGKNYQFPQFPVYLNDGANQFSMNRTSSSKFSFSFYVSGGNGHQCSGTGIAKHQGGSFERIPDTIETIKSEFPLALPESLQGIDQENKQCELKVEFTPHFVRLEGNGYCKSYFACGERTSVFGEFFRNDPNALNGYGRPARYFIKPAAKSAAGR